MKLVGPADPKDAQLVAATVFRLIPKTSSHDIRYQILMSCGVSLTKVNKFAKPTLQPHAGSLEVTFRCLQIFHYSSCISLHRSKARSNRNERRPSRPGCSSPNCSMLDLLHSRVERIVIPLESSEREAPMVGMGFMARNKTTSVNILRGNCKHDGQSPH